MATSVTGHRIFASVLVPAMFLILIGCSTPNQAPLIRGNIIVSPATVPVGERATITVIATDPDSDPVVFYWEAKRGSVPAGAQSDTIVYLAPETSGLDTITVTVSDGQEIATQEVRISVIGSTAAPSPFPIETPIAVVTDTPTSPPRETPSPTPIPPEMPQPTTTPQARITNVKDGVTVPPSFSLSGEYNPEITENIWIIVHPLGGGLYPQSMNPCAGESTPRLNNRWEIAVGLGRPGDVGALFEIRVTTAGTEANQFLAQTMQTWCQDNNYVGLSEDELPPGLTEHQRISLVRGSEYWSHPPISNSDLPGELTITSLKEGEAVPQEFVLSGTSSSEVKDSIWVIVFNPNGRFYPQSANACNNIHTIREGNLWQVPIWLGGSDDAGRPFDIITVLADAQADAFLQAKQQASCQANSYSGFLSLQLPPGLDEKASIRVIRQ